MPAFAAKFVDYVKAVPSLVVGSILATTDTLDIVYQKIQSLLQYRVCRTTLTSIFTAGTGGASVTNPVTFLTMTVPAGTIRNGDNIRFRVYGKFTIPAISTSYVYIYIAIGGNNYYVGQFGATSSAFTNVPFFFEGNLSAQTINNSTTSSFGVSGCLSVVASSTVTWRGSVPANITGVNTGTSQSVSLGYYATNASASNSFTINNAIISFD